MILKGSQRGGALNLARHLLNTRDNDHVTVHAVEGFIAADVTGALMEMYALSRATKCRQFMFSLSLSPPKNATVTVQDFEDAINHAAEKLGLQHQPRVVLFHEKNARLHAHAVFSRIDMTQMRAVNLPFYKERLNDLARELYLSHGWELPQGLVDRSLSNPLNFRLAEWQEAQRAKRDPREIKAALKACFTQSDGAASFAAALKERGFWLARGSRRGFVVLDYRGNVYSLSRWLDVKPKELKVRLGDPVRFASVETTLAEIAATITTAAQRTIAEIERKHEQVMKALQDERRRIVTRQRVERKELAERQAIERAAQARDHAQRFRRGLKGLFDWITGKYAQMRRTVEAETEAIHRHAEAAFDALRLRDIKERTRLQMKIERQRQCVGREKRALIDLFSGPRSDIVWLDSVHHHVWKQRISSELECDYG
ncbi:relaxase/mobilization nuclease domain-containing protein [Shinella sp.]|uniref:relaxase/mobilization nuclease domain-containing protein n=1 Tax=Shinella sp. TaxID=1870904 RepID=UPI003F72CB21